MAVDFTQHPFPARRVLIGVSGSIASVTVPQSILWLRHELGIEVRVVMTRQATTMVTPRAIAVAAGTAVALDDTADCNSPAVQHMDLSRWADLMLVLPASANLLAKAAHGIADDLLTTCIIAASCPVVFVPGMNELMWRKPAVQRNVATLQGDGYGVVMPVEGLAVADGKPTVGAMPEIDAILEWVARFLEEKAGEERSGEERNGAASMTADALTEADVLADRPLVAQEISR